MDDIDREQTFNTQIECPRCVSEGIVSNSGYAARLMYMPQLDPPYRCLAVHGGLSEGDIVDAGVDRRLLQKRTPAPFPVDATGRSTGVAGGFAEPDEESKERWEDESPASTPDRRGPGLRISPAT